LSARRRETLRGAAGEAKDTDAAERELIAAAQATAADSPSLRE